MRSALAEGRAGNMRLVNKPYIFMQNPYRDAVLKKVGILMVEMAMVGCAIFCVVQLYFLSAR